MNRKVCKFFSALERHMTIVVILFCISFVLWLYLFIYDDTNATMQTVFRTSTSKNLKYVLLWTRADYAPFYFFQKGQTAFLNNNCSHINCFVTNNRSFFGTKMTEFDAVIFNGRNLDVFDLPKKRSPHQRYIYMMTESADNNPVCKPIFNNFFNWTATYTLDSEIPTTYMVIRYINGEIVGPKLNMQWVSLDSQKVDFEEKFYRKLQMKTKIAAWFSSNCQTRSGREILVDQLQKALNVYGLKIDIYGDCGTLNCTKNDDVCDEILGRDYFFYLAFENSLARDYTTEKVLRAMQNDVVPIVYGGANYSRFLPPGSYIKVERDEHSIRKLAAMMHDLSVNLKNYSQFFKWKFYYTFHSSEKVENICNLCAALNNRKLLKKQHTYGTFQRWWNPRHGRLCDRA